MFLAYFMAKNTLKVKADYKYCYDNCMYAFILPGGLPKSELYDVMARLLVNYKHTHEYNRRKIAVK